MALTNRTWVPTLDFTSTAPFLQLEYEAGPFTVRGVNRPGQSVAGLFELQPVITRNQEIGVNWRGARGSAGASFYDSRSKLGTVMRINREGLGVLDRVPTTVRGWEVSAEAKASRTFSVSATYAKTMGRTAAAAGAPMDLALGARSQAPDKLVLGANWQPVPGAQVRLQATRLANRDINIGRRAVPIDLEEHFRGYTLADLATTWDTRWGRFGAGIENLADRQYIGYYPQSVNFKDPLSYFAGRGRTFSVSYTRNF